MAHQTGITASSELETLICQALSGKLRMLQVLIDQSTEQLVPGEVSYPNRSWEDDFDTCIQPVLGDSPCYIFYRLDERNSYEKHLWAFFTYAPDDAKVRDKMLYAATKATLKKAFSSGVLVDDVNATKKEELSLEGYHRHTEASKAPPPLTREEQELKDLHDAEDFTDIGTSTRQSHLHGVAFPIQTSVINALQELKEKKIQYVQLEIDIAREEIQLSRTEVSATPDSLPSYIPGGSPRYHFYRFKRTHEGDYKESIVFIYSCPGYKSTIKERMLYSSCKQPLTTAVEQQCSITIEKKVELDDPSELSEQYLMDEVHPKTQAYRPKFDKPKPPQRRAGKKK